MDSVEQESLGESTGGSTTKDGSKKFRSLAEVYADTLEEKLEPDEVVLFTANEPTTYREVATGTMW